MSDHLLPALDTERSAVYHTDLFTLCAAMPDQSVDMILADLPYGTTACSWDTVIPFEPMWAAFKRIIKPRCAIVLTASQPFTSALVMSWPEGFRYEWVWDKVMVSNVANAKKMPLRSHESILIFGGENLIYYPELSRASKPFGKKSATKSKIVGSLGVNYQTGVGYPKSILRYPRPNNLTGGCFHPTQKPIALFRYLIRTYTRAGELVFDPVVGSGTTALAARAEERRFIVGDSSAEYVEIARRRLAQPYTPDMFALAEAQQQGAD